MKVVEGSDILAVGEAMAELKRLSRGPVRRLTTHSEIIFGGTRLAAGTYEIQRVDDEPEKDPPF